MPVFEASVGGNDINGCDLLHLDEDGKIDDILVTVRPLSAAKDLSAALGSEFRQILAETANSTRWLINRPTVKDDRSPARCSRYLNR